MGFHRVTITLGLLLVLLALTECRRGYKGGRSGGSSEDDDDDHRRHDPDRHRHHRHHHDHDHHHRHWRWGSAAGVGVIFGTLLGIAALVSLISCLTCKFYSKCRKDRVSDSTFIKVGSHGSTPPYWASHLVFKPELAAGFGLLSDGFLRLGPAQLVRHKPGTAFTDGAKWAMPMSKGRHVFEITWPWGHRGNHASVGLAMEECPIKVKGTVPLVGSNSQSWGLDIVKRKAIHGNKSVMKCPTDGSYVPDKFLVYVDLEEGTLGYGNDVTYWGEVISGLPKQGAQPLFLMVGASKCNSELSVMYRGSASEGEDTKADCKPPHHLPPLFNNSQAPPMYREMDEKAVGGPIMVMPAVPPSEKASTEDPPPPYSRPPSGCSMRSDKV